MQADLFVKAHLDAPAESQKETEIGDYSEIDDAYGDYEQSPGNNMIIKQNTSNGRTAEKMIHNDEIITNNGSHNNHQIEVPQNLKKMSAVAKKERYGKPTKRQMIINNNSGNASKQQFFDNGMPMNTPVPNNNGGQQVDLSSIPWDRLVKWVGDSDDEFGDLSPRTRGVRSTKRDQDIEDILQ